MLRVIGFGHSFGRVRLGIAAVLVASLLAACGSDSNGGGSSDNAASSDDSNVAYATQQIERYKKIPTFTAPGPSFDAAKAMKGKSIVQIPFATTIPFHQGAVKGMQDAAKSLGLDFRVWTNTGQVSQWDQGLKVATSQNASAVDLFTITPDTVAAPIAAARKAGVKVISTQAYGIGQEHFKDLDAEIPFKYAEVGRLLADWVIMKTGGKANVLLLGADNSPNTFPLKDAFNAEMAKRCTNDCKTKYISVATPNWATQLQPDVQAAVVADPNINYVVPMYDGMATPVVAALRQTHNTKNMPIATFNGSPNVLDMVRNGTVAMDIGEPAQWVGRAVLDADMRVIAGMEPPKELAVPLRIFDSSNVAEAGEPATIDKGYGDAAEAGFAKVWQLP